MKYWLDLFTWTTWQEFLKAGGEISGFRENRWRTVQKIKRGDFLLCYLTGLSRFFGVLEVTGDAYKDDRPIWGEAVFPSRVPVRVVLSLSPEYAIPVTLLQSQLSYFQNMRAPNSWTGHFRGSPVEEKQQDATSIIAALEDAQQSPVFRDFDRRKLERRVPVYETSTGLVTVPEDVDEVVSDDDTQAEDESPITHEEIQWRLLSLGAQMGLDVWVARNDRSSSFDGQVFQSISRSSLPRQFDEATNRIIELIDVLWLRGSAIVAAFEIEHTTSVYSGLLRMADLVAMQPNINIHLYIVAPDDRREKVRSEINRPTFSRALKPPLPEICRFIPYSSLKSKLEQAGSLVRYLRPDFLDEIAEAVEAEDV
jgi:EVE domain